MNLKGREKTPDIMAGIMGAQQPESNREITQPNNQGIKQESNKTEATIDEGVKEKATFNLSKSLLNELEDAWLNLRKSYGDKKITKTLIIEEAVKAALQDLSIKGQEGWFYSKLKNQ
jgi:hypothetical protein